MKNQEKEKQTKEITSKVKTPKKSVKLNNKEQNEESECPANAVKKALLKRATGYDTTEVVEEYQESDGEIVMTKRKVTHKNIPPDISAVKIYFEINKQDVKDVSTMTDEELEMQKQELLKILQGEKNGN